MKRAALFSLFLLTACVQAPDLAPQAIAPRAAPVAAGNSPAMAVISRVEAVAEQECRARTRGQRCNYLISIEDDPELGENAFQTVDSYGNPVIILTQSLINAMRNNDELAFALGHEAAHHIAGHLDRKYTNAMTGALLAGALAAIGGADTATVEAAQDAGAQIGARTFSKDYELEADALGAVIAWTAGFDPERGVAYFMRSRDPGNKFLGTHPANAARISTVRETVARLKAGI